MFRISRSKVVEKHPHRTLVRAIARLEQYPESVRLADELFGIGFEVLSSEGLLTRIPLIMPVEATLLYIPGSDSESIGVAYTRYFTAAQKDEMRFVTTPGDEVISRIIQREGVCEFYRRCTHDPSIDILEMKVCELIELATKMNPTKTGFYMFNLSSGDSCSREYDLRVR